MIRDWRSVLATGALAALLFSSVPTAASAMDAATGGAELYRNACASCHGASGRGAPQSLIGFSVS